MSRGRPRTRWARPLLTGWVEGEVAVLGLCGDRHVGFAGVNLYGVGTDQNHSVAVLGERLESIV
jgi:hypothetical protein